MGVQEQVKAGVMSESVLMLHCGGGGETSK